LVGDAAIEERVMTIRTASRHLAAVILVLATAGPVVAAGGARPQAASGQPPVVGEAARDFTLTRIDGRVVTLSVLQTSGPVVVIMLRGWVGYQ
jgi:hypothetical protein